ncbi:gluconokinase [Aerococcus viridans]|uniref:Gluconokinase n=1 Tax=Aerococcus viridans TaxID=1377 RepID=A0A2N6UEU1_9LACT|nr:gluconokinase [Aerococcus viridans]
MYKKRKVGIIVQYFVVDLGTTNLKFALMETPYRILDTMETGNVISQDDAGKHESDPEVVFNQFIDLLSQMQAKYPQVKLLIFSSQMHALLATDSYGNVLQKAMTWADLRAKDIAQEMQMSGQAKEFFALSGTPIHAMNPFVKLAYLNQSYPDLFEDPSIQFMDIKAYIIRRLTGKYVIDHATASSMGLMDIARHTWSKKLLNHVNIQENQLPKLVASRQQIPVKHEVIQHLQLTPDFQILPGSTDGALANLSNQAYAGLEDQSLSSIILSFGTSAAVRTLSDQLSIHESGQIFTYIVDDKPHYIIGGPVNNAGNVLDWLYQQFGFKEKGQSFQDMLQVLMTHHFSASGPYFLPFLNGERAPYWNANLQAEFKGIKGYTSQLDMAKAVFEGVFFEIRQVIDLVYDTTDLNQKIVQVNGKIFSDPKISQWIADILGIPLQYVSGDDASLIGAGVLIESDRLRERLAFTTIEPNQQSREKYHQKFLKFKSYANALDQSSRTILY